FLAAGGIPDLQRLVPATAEDALATRVKGPAGDNVGMSLEGEGLLAAGGIPRLQCLVRAAAEDAPAIRAEGHAIDRTGVPLEGERFLADTAAQADWGWLRFLRFFLGLTCIFLRGLISCRFLLRTGSFSVAAGASRRVSGPHLPAFPAR